MKPLTFLKRDYWKSLTFFYSTVVLTFIETLKDWSFSVELVSLLNYLFASAEFTKISRAEVGVPVNLYWGSRKWVEIIILFTLALLKHFVNDSNSI